MKTIALALTKELCSALEESKKTVLPDGKTVFEPLENVVVVCSEKSVEARVFSAYECGVFFAPFHFVRDCLQKEAEAALFVNSFSPASLRVPDPADTREGLALLGLNRGAVPDAERLTEAARKAGFVGDFPDFEKRFVCKKTFISQGLSVRLSKKRLLTAFVRFRGGERGVSALCGVTRGDPADAPLENKEVLFFDSLYFSGEGDPADAFSYALLETDAPIRFSRRIRPGRSPVPAHLAASLFWGLIGGALLAPFPLPAILDALPLALSLLFSAVRLLAIKLSVRR